MLSVPFFVVVSILRSLLISMMARCVRLLTISDKLADKMCIFADKNDKFVDKMCKFADRQRSVTFLTVY